MKIFLVGIIAMIILVSCAAPLAVTTHYATRENWITVDNLLRVQENSDMTKWASELGKPVVIESNRDTLFYYYHFKPFLYRSWTQQKGWYKPTEEDNTGICSDREEMIRIALINGKVISIKKDLKFSNEPFFGKSQTLAK